MTFFKTVLERLTGRKSQNESVSRTDLGGGFYLTQEYTGNGMGGYSPVNVCLHREDDPGFCRCLVDGRGIIRGFPGTADGKWKKDLQFPADRRVRFTFRVSRFQNGRACVSWTLQPDGRYFEDEDGFGAEHCEEIVLISNIDEKGQFQQPFTASEEN